MAWWLQELLEHRSIGLPQIELGEISAFFFNVFSRPYRFGDVFFWLCAEAFFGFGVRDRYGTVRRLRFRSSHVTHQGASAGSFFGFSEVAVLARPILELSKFGLSWIHGATIANLWEFFSKPLFYLIFSIKLSACLPLHHGVDREVFMVAAQNLHLVVANRSPNFQLNRIELGLVRLTRHADVLEPQPCVLL